MHVVVAALMLVAIALADQLPYFYLRLFDLWPPGATGGSVARALVTAVVGWTQTLWGLAGVRDLTGGDVALAVVWTVVWGGHLWWGRRGTPREHLRLRDLL